MVMNRLDRRCFILAAGALLAAPLAAGQQARPGIRAVGVLGFGTRAEYESELAAFREGLREGGFVEGENLRFEYRFAEHDYRKIDRLAEDLVRAQIEVIYAPTTWAVHGAKSATRTIPIVFTGVNDPVALKFVQSLARPGGNITGISPATHELTAKRVQLMREIFPAAGRLGVIYDKDAARACQVELGEIISAGRQLGVEVRGYPYLEKAELQSAFRSAQGEKIAAVLVTTTIEARRYGSEMIAGSTASRLPMVHGDRNAVEAGGLMSYGPPHGWAPRRAGHYAARILKGAKPADLPVERPMTYELVINLKTARAMDVKIPPSVLLRADRVIE